MKGRKGRAAGGESPAAGTKDWEQDISSKPTRRVNAPSIMNAAEERKRGGKAMGKIHGAAAKMHAGRKARKAGGKVGSTMSPLSSAHAGTPAKGRKLDSMGQ